MRIVHGSHDDTIGGMAPGAGNVLAGGYIPNNPAGPSFGIDLEGDNNVVQGNLIGTDRYGAAAIPHAYGIVVQGNGNLIGGTTAAARNVVGFDPFLSPDRAGQLGIEAATDLAQLLPRCDFLTVHTPLTDETRDLIGAPQLALMRKGRPPRPRGPCAALLPRNWRCCLTTPAR